VVERDFWKVCHASERSWERVLIKGMEEAKEAVCQMETRVGSMGKSGVLLSVVFGFPPSPKLIKEKCPDKLMGEVWVINPDTTIWKNRHTFDRTGR
jgi:hypothetical protein